MRGTPLVDREEKRMHHPVLVDSTCSGYIDSTCMVPAYMMDELCLCCHCTAPAYLEDASSSAGRQYV